MHVEGREGGWLFCIMTTVKHHSGKLGGIQGLPTEQLAPQL